MLKCERLNADKARSYVRERDEARAALAEIQAAAGPLQGLWCDGWGPDIGRIADIALAALSPKAPTSGPDQPRNSEGEKR